MSFESLGYSHEEMANIVVRLLQDIGLLSGHSKLIAIIGHGSSSLNNPHESAYNCGLVAVVAAVRTLGHSLGWLITQKFVA